MKYNYIAIEGNIGAGKTTLARLLAKKYNARLLLEKFSDNPYLAQFYDNPEKTAFPMELFFLGDRYKQLKEIVHTKDLFQHVTVSDYSLFKCLLFAKTNLPEDEFRMYQKLYDSIFPQIIQPEIVLYLHTPVRKLQEQIKKRNRPFELGISDQYLINLQEAYIQYMKQHAVKSIIIDCAEADFFGNEAHLQVVMNALDMDLEDGPHYFTL